ncbi:zinc ribbon domain-containing protein [Geomonas propionica]|uniref:Zinc ribbon domain-containing protein n=1 Tax=Geomonas propionica TaxID=2798582 RepID=A0ABS0YMK9_9BACT|nr:zinc ribbon domain-containing protein [Geomonas propionica]MBJ6799189.1 zinc ribbon domain-containing protein [Geomonas propionica]
MENQSITATPEQAPVVHPGTADAAEEVVESAKTCPSCNYDGDIEFSTCPSCGIIIQKHLKLKLQRANLSTSSEVDAAGETSRSPKMAMLIVCLLVMVFIGSIFYRVSTRPSSSRPTNDTSSPSVPATSDNLASNAPSTNPSAETVPPNPTSPPNTLANSLGIKIHKVVFASDVDASNLPVNDLSRVPFNGKKIVVHIKMEIPPEKAYQFTGKFYDADGKLVMNISSPSSPTLSVWSAWYYHNFDRAVDKPGVWRFVFLVNGEQILENPIEVVDQ